MTERPFSEALAELLEEREMSQRGLSRQITRKGGGETFGAYAINHLVHGNLPPTLRSMSLIAKALNVDPEQWPEYRMAVLRHELNPAKVGFRKALKRLRELERE